MTKTLLPVPASSDRIDALAALADNRRAATVFDDYRRRKAHNTLLRHAADLDAFSVFLQRFGIQRDAASLSSEPAAWRGVTHGIVAAFMESQVALGFAVRTLNARLSTIRTYCGLAARAGVIAASDYALIATVKGYRRTEGKRLDAGRMASRVGYKKALSNVLTSDQITQLIDAGAITPAAVRDALIMVLLCDHGLRVSELCALQLDAVSDSGLLTFYRQKVDLTQTHRLTDRARRLVTRYKKFLAAAVAGAPEPGALLIRKLSARGALTASGITRNGVYKIVQIRGAAAGIANLSPHDLRHSWATLAVQHDTPIDALVSAGGWSSPTTPLTNYVAPAAIANDRVTLNDE